MHKDLDKLISLYHDNGDIATFLYSHPDKDELKQQISDYIEAEYVAFKEWNVQKAEVYFSELQKDFPESYELMNYISTLEEYCSETLGVKDRLSIYAHVSFANRRRDGAPRKSIEKVKAELNKIQKLIEEGNSLESALKIAKISLSTHNLNKKRMS